MPCCMDRVLLTLGNTQLQAVLDRNRGLFVLFQAEVTSAGGSWQAYDASPPGSLSPCRTSGDNDLNPATPAVSSSASSDHGDWRPRLRSPSLEPRSRSPSAFPHLHQLPDPGRSAVCPSRLGTHTARSRPALPRPRQCDAAGAEATEPDLESATGAWRAQPTPPPLPVPLGRLPGQALSATSANLPLQAAVRRPWLHAPRNAPAAPTCPGLQFAVFPAAGPCIPPWLHTLRRTCPRSARR